ncbi:hypothetical protein CDAR_59851 [Caerostris darwini]|uniref:Uncharacterized protein n=1 Tax=Caerostris darwini TaxID=1538125 RepID=A0AAV4RQ52_9ARAC|nr:hypothetical protein CDAR_59851 [Caerostris darwini]
MKSMTLESTNELTKRCDNGTSIQEKLQNRIESSCLIVYFQTRTPSSVLRIRHRMPSLAPKLNEPPLSERNQPLTGLVGKHSFPLFDKVRLHYSTAVNTRRERKIAFNGE